MKPFYLIILLVMNFCWSGVYASYKVIDQGLGTGGIVTLRFGIAGLCLLLAWPWLPGRAPRGQDLLLTCLMGLMLFVLGQRLQVYGNQLGTAGNSAVLIAFEPLVTTVAAAIFLREYIGLRRWAGFVLGLCGVAMLHGVWRRGFQWTGLTASLFFISSFVCEGAYSVMGKPIVQRASVMKMLAISLLVGTAGNLMIDGPATMDAARSVTPGAWGLLLVLAVVCTVIGYTVWFVIIRECPINLAALTVFSQAIFGVTIAAVWLGEPVRWDQAWGCLTIVAGLALGLCQRSGRGIAQKGVGREVVGN